MRKSFNELGNESAVQFHKFPNQLGESFTVNSRQSNPRRGLVQTFHVLVRTEQPNLTIAVLVGLHSFEAFERIMEDTGRWVEAEVLVRNDTGIIPTGFSIPFNGKHMI